MLTIAIIAGIWRFMRKRGLLLQLYKAGFAAATMLFLVALPMNSFAAGYQQGQEENHLYIPVPDIFIKLDGNFLYAQIDVDIIRRTLYFLL